MLYLDRKKFDDVDFDLPVEVAGIRFRNPFFVSSGPTTSMLQQLIKAAECGFAGASCKLTFDPPPYINRRPRYGWDDKQHLLYFSAEKRINLDEACRLIEAMRKQDDSFVLFSNFTYSEPGLEGWVNMAKKFEEAGAHINELNMCCPNMSFNVELAKDSSDEKHQTGASLGQQEEAIQAIIRAIKQETSIPVCVKITPEGGRQHIVAKACLDAGADMVCGVANRLALPAIRTDEPGKSTINLQEEQGMYCMNSYWIKPLALRDVYMMRKSCGPEAKILGTGGITTWNDGVEMIMTGADLVGICSATIIYGFGFFPEFFRGFRKYVEEHGYQNPLQMRDKIVESVKSAPELTLWEGYASQKDPNLVAPCDYACPHHVPAMAYVRLVAQGKFEEAYQQITSKNPLQHTCGYICNHPCEDSCTRGLKDQPIRIRAIKRFVMDKAEQEGWVPNIEQAPPNGIKVAVIGSGPGGISAAHTLARAGYEVTVFEREAKGGGMLRYGIPEFRLPRKLIDREFHWLDKLGVKVVYQKALGVDFTLDDLRSQDFKAICITVGTQKGQLLGIPGEDAQGYYTAVDFIRAHASGKDLPLGDSVAIVGGGFTAVDAARIAARKGVKNIYICYRRTRDEMPAVPEEVYEAEEEGVRVMYLVSPLEIIKTGEGKISGLRLRSNVLGMDTGEGRRRPEGVQGAEFVLACDTVISAVSQELDQTCAGLGLEMTGWGTLAYDESTGGTSVEDIFVAGDAALGPSTVIQSVDQGKRAAVSIDRKLTGKLAVLEYDPVPTPVDPKDVINRSTDVQLADRVALKVTPPEIRKTNYDLYEQVMTGEEAVAEASRCLHCGCGIGCQICEELCMRQAWDEKGNRVEVDKDECVACGMCVFRCPNSNIEMVKGEISPPNVSYVKS
jgi:NADPH-dependent glutamate synthase beta subunit-like oxidoreductase/dihydroorotate dehydrogenase/NAD-dependent dihydropyrimidine dehydrogenase PreA subunit